METKKAKIGQCEVCGEVTNLDENDVCAYCYPLVSGNYFDIILDYLCADSLAFGEFV